MTRLCRHCHERPVIPSRAKRGQYICSKCNNNVPSNRAARLRYRASDHGRAVMRRRNAKQNPRRIYIGYDYHSKADTPELASRINAHIKGRLNAFKQGQQDREEVEGAASG